MTTPSDLNIYQLIDTQNGRVTPRIYTDPEIYELELERIFGRCWLFLATKPNPQNLVISLTPTWGKMGCRSASERRQHQGVSQPMSPPGHACQLCRLRQHSRLTCPYHGWSMALTASLWMYRWNLAPTHKGCVNPTGD